MPVDPPVVTVPVPGGKSAAIRALVLASLARGRSRVTGAPGSSDVRAVAAALRGLGVRVEGEPGAGDLVVHGTGGSLPPGERRVSVGGSASGLRLLACVAAVRPGRTVIDGDASLRARPAGPLAEALAAVGVPVSTRRGRPPVAIEGGTVAAPDAPVDVDGAVTSQVVSGMLLLGAALPGGLRVRVPADAVSRPYVELTLSVIRAAGLRVRRSAGVVAVRGGPPRGFRFAVERDWSSAAYPLVAAAILGRRVRVPGVRARGPQADRAVIGLLRAAGVPAGTDARGAWASGGGAIRPFIVDLRDAPDLAPAAAALALFAAGESRVRGAAHLRAKESDRIAACVAAVRALGGTARATADGFTVRGGSPRRGAVDARGDHRIALAFSVAAAAIPGARVRDTACVRKSWPGALDAMAVLLRGARRRPRGPAHSSGGVRAGG